jgi:uncharacterized membrane protein YGL010W
MPRKSADDWLGEYGASHQHAANKAIHWICVPAIASSILALLWEAPVPWAASQSGWLNWATLLLVAALAFYVRLSPSLAVGMLVFSLMAMAAVAAYDRWGPTPLWQAALAAFFAAWAAQFIGHAIEGKKPSFLEDIQFLLIGPIWLLAFVYRRFGIPY